MPIDVPATIPLWLLYDDEVEAWRDAQDAFVAAWLGEQAFRGEKHRVVLIPDEHGALRSAVGGLGRRQGGLSLWHGAGFAERLPPRHFRLAQRFGAHEATQLQVGFLYGGYRFERYRPSKLERAAVVNDVAGYLGIDKGLVLESFRKMSAGGAQAATRPEPEPMRHRDRILLSVLLSEAGHREEFFGYLKALPSLKTGPAGRIYEALIALYDTGEPLSFSALHDRLPEAEQELLAAALIRNETEGEAPSVDEGLACLEALVEEERGTEKNALKTRVREAERAGNLAEALRLSGELTKLQNRA